MNDVLGHNCVLNELFPRYDLVSGGRKGSYHFISFEYEQGETLG